MMSEPAPDTATPVESLSVLERWARVSGRVTSHPGGLWEIGGFDRVLHISQRSTVGGKIEAYWEGPGSSADPRSAVRSVISIETAIAWALALDSGLPPVDVGRCQACVKRGGPMEWDQATWEGQGAMSFARGTVERFEQMGWHVALVKRPRTKRPRRAGHVAVLVSRPCPDCNGTGRETIDVARLVLDAAPSDNTCGKHACTNCGSIAGVCGDTPSWLIDERAREHLTILAEQLQQQGQRIVCPETFESHAKARAWVAANARPGDKVEVLREQDIDNLRPPEFRPVLWRTSFGEALGYLLSRHIAGDDRGTAVGVRALREAWERLTVPCERCDGKGEMTRRFVNGIPMQERPGTDARAFRDLRDLPEGILRGEHFLTFTFTCHVCHVCNGHGRVKRHDHG